LVSDLEYKNDPIDMTSSALPLTKHNSKGYSKGENKAITP